MRKTISLAFLILCLFLIYQTGVTFFKKGHEVEYTIKTGEHTFQIQEHLKNNKYYFRIHTGAYHFYLEEDNQFNKMKQMIDEVEFSLENNVMCIYPRFKKGISKSMMCSDGSKMYAYEASKGMSASLKLVQDIQEKKIDAPFLKTEEEIEQKSGQITYYPNALDETVVLWFYQGFFAFDQEHSFREDTIDFDRYENTHSKLAGKYYITPQYIDNRLYEFSSVIVFDITNHVKYELGLGTTLSNYTYVSGVVDSKLYLFDKNTMQQVEIQPKSKKARVIARGNEDALYYNGKWENRNIYDFVNQQVTFSYFDDTELKARYSYQSAYMGDDSYYYYDGVNFYQVYKDSLNDPILLFQVQNIKDIQVVDGYIYYVLGDTLYKYSPGLTRRRIMVYPEFQYNSSKLYDIYRK